MFGPYRATKKLGGGAAGTVYAAERNGGLVALKVLDLPPVKGGPDSEEARERARLRRRFLLEAEALRRVRSAHVVEYVDYVDMADCPPVLAMRLIVGEDLRTLLCRDTQLPAQQALQIARQVLTGLTAAHEVRCVHRDVKPENVMIEQTGSKESVAILTDLGASLLDGTNKGLTSGHDAAGQEKRDVVIGTPGYMAPEQALGMPLTAACDIFGVGSILHEAASGWPLIYAEELLPLVRMVICGASLDTPLVKGTYSEEKIEAARQVGQEILRVSPKIEPDKISHARVLMLLTTMGLYNVKSVLEQQLGSRAYRLLKRMVAYEPKERPTAKEATAELQFILDNGLVGKVESVRPPPLPAPRTLAETEPEVPIPSVRPPPMTAAAQPQAQKDQGDRHRWVLFPVITVVVGIVAFWVAGLLMPAPSVVTSTATSANEARPVRSAPAIPTAHQRQPTTAVPPCVLVSHGTRRAPTLPFTEGLRIGRNRVPDRACWTAPQAAHIVAGICRRNRRDHGRETLYQQLCPAGTQPTVRIHGRARRTRRH